MEPLDFGDFEPRRRIEGGSVSWPLSWASQMNEARNHLRRLIITSGADVTRGGQVLVHWNRLPPTRLAWREVDGLDFYDEFDPKTGERVTRAWDSLTEHVADIHAAAGVKPFDRPPGVDRPD